MMLDEFRRLAAIWGSNIERWPESARDAARQIASRTEARLVLDEQAALDRILAVAPDIDAGRADNASFRVLQRLATMPQASTLSKRRLFRWPTFIPAASLACSVLAGAWLATAAPYRPEADPYLVVSGLFDVYVIGSGLVQ
jgi:hypothetical protein